MKESSAFNGITELKGSIKTKIRLSCHAKNVVILKGSVMLSVELFTYQKSCKTCKSDCVAIVE